MKNVIRRIDRPVTCWRCFGIGLVFMSGVAVPATEAMAQSRPAEAPVSDPAAQQALEAHLQTLKEIKTLEVNFICEKKLALLDSPLVSSGQLWIKRGEKSGGGSVRFSTQQPYVSELILTGGKVYARSQHEKNWTATNQSSRPGLTAVMLQLGEWSTGEVGKLTDMYAVEKSGDKAPPTPLEKKNVMPENADVFALSPVNKDLAIAIKQIRLALAKGPGKESSRLVFAEIQTTQGDLTRYWFFDGKLNAELPADVFKPEAGSGAEKSP